MKLSRDSDCPFPEPKNSTISFGKYYTRTDGQKGRRGGVKLEVREILWSDKTQRHVDVNDKGNEHYGGVGMKQRYLLQELRSFSRVDDGSDTSDTSGRRGGVRLNRVGGRRCRHVSDVENERQRVT